MYNILVTDDEQIVVDALFFIINKNFEGQVKLFSANNGADAVNICSQNEIDIIFMDINMPGMTGLEAIKCILNLKPQTVIIILSAFDSFQYAQEALNLGAFKYITKPVNRNLVVQMIRLSMNAVDTRRAVSADGSELQKKLDRVTPVLEGDFFYNCVFNKAKSEDVYTYLDYFNIQEEHYAIGCFEFPDVNPANQDEIYLKARDAFHSHAKCLVSSLLVNRIIVFFYFERFEERDMDECARESIKNLYNVLGIKVLRGIRGGVCKCFSDISQIAEKYSFALNALNSASAKGDLVFSDEKKNSSAGDDDYAENILSRLYNRLKIGDTAGVTYLVRTYLEILDSQARDFDYKKSHSFEILVNARNILRDVDSKNRYSYSHETFSIISNATSETALSSYLVGRLEEIANNIHEIKLQRGNPMIAKVVAYLDQNISSDLSLESASLVAGVNPFYLSKLFREETGDTFVNYIAEKRMELAKNLLSNTELSIKEITAEIGYNDQNYFSKLFKAKFGISPTDFRKSK